ncbi:MAG: DUF6029 family protein [Saprospiraceae bacterium]|nr:DUF6029 family protein [Saprospiraceae bacterium]
MKHLFPLFFCTILLVSGAQAQNTSRISGNLQSNGNFFIRDSASGAAGTPQYDYQKFGAESWLNLNYSNWGFDVGVRFDVFNNSNLLNPTGSYTDEGIGRWYVRKKIDKFDLAGGYLYDQIGSGIIFRAFEERALAIDNALYGIRLGYELHENWKIRAFTGRQKRQFTRYGTVIRGGVLEGFIKPDSTKNFTLAPGIGVVARTYDDETVTGVINTIANYAPQDSTSAQYNTYAATVFNTLTYNAFTWYAEGALKSNDVINDPFTERVNGVRGVLSNRKGYTVYTSVSFAKNGLGITVEGKRTQDFSFRNSPFAEGFQGALNFLPPMARQNTYRLTARFSPATQELGEQAVQFDLRYALNKRLDLGFNFSEIRTLENKELYREIAPEFTYKYQRKWQLIGGIQILKYNIGVYQGEEKGTYVDAVTPYAEYLYKFTPRRSLRIEAQYLATQEEFGSWVNVVVELGLAPHWLVYVSDMYKLKHDESGDFTADETKYDGLHYPSVGVVYTRRANRFSMAYVKQVEGINCAGGICRLEPAFSGVRLQVTSSF